MVRAEGELAGVNAPGLRDELIAAIDRNSGNLVINLTGATFADATGLNVLMGAVRAAEIIGGEVRLVGAGRRLRDLLVQAGLHPAFEDGAVDGATDRSVSDRALGGAVRHTGDGVAAPDPALDGTTEEAALRAEIARLRESMQGQAVIEQAKGVLMLRYAVDDDQAIELLGEWSRRSNTPVHTVADILVNAICRGARSPDYDTKLVRWLELQLRRAPQDGTAAR